MKEEEAKIEEKKWTDFGLDEKILYAIKKNLNFYEPTSIQRTVITEALKGKDILAKSATGTGKVKRKIKKNLILIKKDSSSFEYYFKKKIF